MTLTQHILDFLKQINIPVKETKLDQPTFLPGILIERGTLILDPEKLKYPGDLIHEAGHIALMNNEEKKIIAGDVSQHRTPGQDDEMAVLAWTFAASKHLGLPLDIIFHEDGYKGASPMLIDQFETGNYIGLPLLVWMDLCDYESFPKMKKWVRD
ncbi:hypothetical protein [Algoriphagus sp. PAP.12]|uniref:hypothetical protein n=1 Tax=Algoriphagus sp. PAP.12 TaxID=2996678 RepID=UPI00227BD163|nr:hypothetical protein [Algoriphagus sp. PAP.12]